MLRLLISSVSGICAAFLLYALYLTSCGFIDLRPISYVINPDTGNTILDDMYSPVTVSFDTEMIKDDAEKILQISSDMGAMRGDYSWNGNTLYFTPIAPWTAGIRYTASFLGTARSADGRELRVEHFVSFYAINKNDPPMLLSHSPENGASIKTGETVFEFVFSREMDKLTTESAITIEGIGSKTFEWSNDERTIRIIADKSLSPWLSYRWNIKESAKSKSGVPLAKTYSGYFTTDQDQVLPYVEKVYPVLFSDGSWYPTGLDIETGLASGQGIAVEFNKPMGENTLRSVRFEPSLTGRTEWLTENSIVYIFTKDLEPETIYTLIVSADTRDAEGLKTGFEYKINFYPDIPFINILSVLQNGGELTENIVSNIILPVRPDPAMGEIFFSIRFSLPFITIEEKLNTSQRISLIPFFPRTLNSVAIKSINWVSDDCIFIRWEGLKAGDIDATHYYKLTIPGGKGGITNGDGMIMKEDISIFLEAVNE